MLHCGKARPRSGSTGRWPEPESCHCATHHGTAICGPAPGGEKRSGGCVVSISWRSGTLIQILGRIYATGRRRSITGDRRRQSGGWLSTIATAWTSSIEAGSWPRLLTFLFWTSGAHYLRAHSMLPPVLRQILGRTEAPCASHSAVRDRFGSLMPRAERDSRSRVGLASIGWRETKATSARNA